MEGKKYNLAKAQEEADKLRKKVEFGDAPDYGEAEKLLEGKTTNDPVNEYQRKKLNEFRQKLFASDYSSVIFSLNHDLSKTYDKTYDLNKSPFLSDFIKTPEAKAEFQKKEFIDFLIAEINEATSAQYDVHKNLMKYLNLFDLLDVSELIFQRKEVGEIGQKALLNCVSGAYEVIKDTARIIDKFNIPQSFVESKEVKQIVADKRISPLIKTCRMDYLEKIKELRDFFKIPNDIIKEKALTAIIDSVNGNYYFDKEYFLKLKQFFNIDIPDERIQDGVKQIILKRLAEGPYRLEGIEKTIKNTGIPLSILQSEEISQSVKIKMIESLGYGSGESFDQYREIFQIPESTINSQEFRSAWINGAVRNLQSVFSGLSDHYEPNFIRSNERIVKFKKCVPFGDELMESPEVQNVIKENFWGLQEYIDSKRLIVIVDFLPESIKSSTEIKNHIQKVINYRLRGNDFIPAINLTHAFDLPEAIVNEIYLPKIIKLLQESKKVFQR